MTKAESEMLNCKNPFFKDRKLIQKVHINLFCMERFWLHQKSLHDLFLKTTSVLILNSALVLQDAPKLHQLKIHPASKGKKISEMNKNQIFELCFVASKFHFL